MPVFHYRKSFAWMLFQNENATRLEQSWHCLVCEEFFREPLTGFCLFVRRIGKDYVEHFDSRSVLEKIENILLSNSSFQLCPGEIALDDLRRLSIFLNKNNRRRAAAKRFNSQRAASCEKIEDPRAHHRVAQARKDSGFNAVHCWPYTAFGNCQAEPAGAAGDHSHGDEAGVGDAIALGSASCGEAEAGGTAGAPLPASAGSGDMGAASSICFFFFFARSFFPPPRKLLIMLLRSRPTSRSIRFVLGRSIVPPT